MCASFENVEMNLDEIITLLVSMGETLDDWPRKMARVGTLIHGLPDALTSLEYTFLTTGHRGDRYKVSWQIYGDESVDFNEDRLKAEGVDGIFKDTFFLNKNGSRTLPDPYIDHQDRLGSTKHRYSDAIHFLRNLKLVARNEAFASNTNQDGITLIEEETEESRLLQEFKTRHKANRSNNWHCGFFSRSNISEQSTWSDVVNNSKGLSLFYNGNREVVLNFNTVC